MVSFVGKTVGKLLGGSAPKAPSPEAQAQAQMGMNREAILESAKHSQIGQRTPFGSLFYTGELGSPERTQHVSLHPAEQERLDARRTIQSGLLNLALTGDASPTDALVQALSNPRPTRPTPPAAMGPVAAEEPAPETVKRWVMTKGGTPVQVEVPKISTRGRLLPLPMPKFGR